MSKNPFDDDEPEEDEYNSKLSTETPVSNGRYDMQSQIMDSKARALASQKRSLQSIAHSEQIGNETATELADQGDKLTRAENKLYEIENMQQESQHQIRSLSSFFGSFGNIFRRSQPAPVPPIVRNNSDRSRTSVPPVTSGGQMKQKQTTLNAPAPQSEFDENLNQMSVGISRLKSLAQDMNTEMQTQNEQLERMGTRMEGVNTTLASQNKQMNKLLGR